jgi:hypothetical protein
LHRVAHRYVAGQRLGEPTVLWDWKLEAWLQREMKRA